MLKKILTFAFLIASGAASFGTVTVTANGVGANLVLSATGGTLAAGTLIRLGFFSNASILGTDNSFSDLNSTFTPLGEGIANAGILSQPSNAGNTLDINNIAGPGTFAGTYNSISSTYLPTGAQLYMWVFNSAAANTATQWGIFDAPSWTFPADPSSTSMSLSAPSISVLRGSTNGTSFNLAVIPVPEPATPPVLIGALALAALVWRKTRRAR